LRPHRWARRVGARRGLGDDRIFGTGGGKFDEDDRAEQKAAPNQQQKREAIDHGFAAAVFSPSR